MKMKEIIFVVTIATCVWNVAHSVSAADVSVFNGSYNGSYSGTAHYGGTSGPVSGSVAFIVANGAITVTDPGSGSGTVSSAGSAFFNGGGAGNGAAYTFDGTFTVSSDGSAAAGGRWSATFTGGTADGQWSAARPPTPVITSAVSVSAKVGVPVNYAITATNNPTEFGAGGLPPGLSINTSTGAILGTPTLPGSFEVLLTATNAAGPGVGILFIDVFSPLGRPPVPTFVPQLAEFPGPGSLFFDMDRFVLENAGKFSPASGEYLMATAQATKPLIDPASPSFIKKTVGNTANALKTFCNIGGLITAAKGGGLVTAAGAIMATVPFLDLTEEQEKSVGYAGLLAVGVAAVAAGPVATQAAVALVLVDLNFYIYGSLLAPVLERVAVDPPDSSYQSVVIPDPVRVGELPSSGNGTLDAALSKSYLDVLLAQSFLSAANASYDRYSAAYAASDAISAGLQLEALLYYLSLYDQAIQDSAADLMALQPLLVAAGVSDEAFNAGGLSSFQANIAANGLPPEATQALTSIGITAPQIQAAQARLLAVDPKTISGTLFGTINNVANAALRASSHPPTQLGNISTRMTVGRDDNALIGGFIITGIQPKTVIVRGIGPSLSSFFSGVLADPIIEVHGSSGELLATNDNWQDAATKQEIIDSGIPPTNDLESALWGIINPGAYTVVVRGKNNATGIGLFEVYDLDRTVDSKLANISTRGFVGTGDNVMIGGTIITGAASTNVMVRAIGPSLTNFGVPNALQDPGLELHDAQGGIIASNDNWIDSPDAAAISAVKLQPSDNRESAILQNLAPGQYTAIVRGNGNSIGVALVEAYQLQ